MISWNLENGKANKAERFDYDQVMLFGIMAIEIKRKAPYAHTVCEIVKARYVAFFTQMYDHISLLCQCKQISRSNIMMSKDNEV